MNNLFLIIPPFLDTKLARSEIVQTIFYSLVVTSPIYDTVSVLSNLGLQDLRSIHLSYSRRLSQKILIIIIFVFFFSLSAGHNLM